MNLNNLIREINGRLAKLERSDARARARGYALHYEELLEDKYGNDPDFQAWDPNRALNLQDFDYLFYHRDRYNETIKNQLELISAKITYVKEDGEDGYFHKLERNVGWTKNITPLVMCQVHYVDKLVRCGMWANCKNSRRCHKPDCPCCHWNDFLKVTAEAFGAESGTYSRMQASGLTAFFPTLSFTTNPKNAKCFGRDFESEDISYQPGDLEYDPYPVRLGLSDNDATWPSFGYEDAQLLGMICQQAVEQVYRERLLAGYRFKIEGAFKLVPGGSNQANLHAHIIANGHENDPQVLAEALFAKMKRGLRRYSKHLNRTYFADVLVLRLNTAEELDRVVKYCDKVTPFGLIVEEAISQPEAKRQDGTWDPKYFNELRNALARLVNDDIPAIFSGSGDSLFQPLRRRKACGNMVFNDRGTCIGQEPIWNRSVRRKRAAEQRRNRLERKREQQQKAVMEEAADR